MGRSFAAITCALIALLAFGFMLHSTGVRMISDCSEPLMGSKSWVWIGVAIFLFAGIATMLGGVAVFFTTQKRAAVERGIVLKRRYSLYYLLNFLQGLRKQMFITFAIFALVMALLVGFSRVAFDAAFDK